jgi:hypothetical protein
LYWKYPFLPIFYSGFVVDLMVLLQIGQGNQRMCCSGRHAHNQVVDRHMLAIAQVNAALDDITRALPGYHQLVVLAITAPW